MKPKVCIAGIDGNMGKRYKYCCEYLNIDVCGFDKHDFKVPNDATHFIIATPTDIHLELISWASTFKKPILCEKPVVKTKERLDLLIDTCKEEKIQLYMVNNYAYLKKEPKGNLSYYSYYNTGNDGLLWDCIQILHLAKGKVEIDGTSPVWKCAINGMEYDRADMDLLYLLMIQDFVGKQKNLWDINQIELATRTVLNHEKNTDSNTSSKRIITLTK